MPTHAQPRSLGILVSGETFERLSYYGTQAILVLYLSKVFLFSDNKNYSIYGVYTTLIFALPIFGGILADRLMGTRQAIISGATLLILGNVLLALQQARYLDIGLALTVCGTGLYKGNMTSTVGRLYEAQDPRRETGFTFLYMGMNIGATFGAIIYALLTQHFGWSYGFIFGALAIAVNLILFIFTIPPSLLPHTRQTFSAHGLAYLLIISISLLVSLIFRYPSLLGDTLIIFSVALVLALGWVATKYDKTTRNHLITLLILYLTLACFFAASLQTSSSISLFIERTVNHTVGRWLIPTALFTSLYPLAVIAIAPLSVIVWRRFSQQAQAKVLVIKLTLALSLASLGFICFSLAARSSYNAASHFALLWIVVGNLCLGAGELTMFPAILSATSLLAPRNFQSTLIGVCFLFVAFGGYLSSLIAKFSSHEQAAVLAANKIISIAIYQHLFINIAIAAGVIAGVIAVISPWLKQRLITNLN